MLLAVIGEIGHSVKVVLLQTFLEVLLKISLVNKTERAGFQFLESLTTSIQLTSQSVVFKKTSVNSRSQGYFVSLHAVDYEFELIESLFSLAEQSQLAD